MAGKGIIEKRGANKWRLTAACGLDANKKQIRKTKTITVKTACDQKTCRDCTRIQRCQARREAEKLLSEFINEVEKGLFIGPTKLTFADFTERWLLDYAEKNLEPKTVETYKEKLTRILQAMGHLKIEQIKPTHLLQFYANLQEDGVRLDGKPGGLSPRSIHHHHRVISAILQDAVEWQVIPFNPASRVKPPKVPKKQAAYYDEIQTAALLMALENEPLKYKTAIILTIATGLREGELMGLEWCDIDFKENTLEVRQASQYLPSKGVFTKEPKNETSKRIISVPDPVMALLKQYKAHQAKERLKVGDLWQGSGVLSNFTELFDAVTPKDVSVVKVLKRLRNQSGTTEKWEENIQVIADKVNNEEVIQELRRLGNRIAPEIAALSTLSSKQLHEYISLCQVKNSRGGRLFVTWDGRPMHTYSVGAWFANFLKQTTIHKPCNKVIGNTAQCPYCKNAVKNKDVYKLPPLPFHGLRHTAATLLIGKGLHAKTISSRLGHSNISTTMDIYGHFLKSADKEAANKLNHLFSDANKAQSE